MSVLPTAAFTLLLATAATPAVAQVVTLEQLRAKALGERPALALDDARIAQAEAQVAEAAAPGRPRVAGRVQATASPGSELVRVREPQADGGFGDEEFIVSGSKTIDDGLDAFDPQLRYSAQVGVDWNFWDFGRTAAGERAARAELRARQAEAAQTRRSLIAAIDEVYLEWLGAHRRVELEAETVGQLSKRLEDLGTTAEAGSLAPSALLPVEADLAAAALRKAYAEEGLALARLAVGEAVGEALAPDATPDPKLLEYGATGEPGVGDEDDTTAAALRARVRAARATAHLHDKRYNPQLSASVSAGLRGQFDTLFPFYAAVIGLDLPMYDGGAGAARAAAARADARALELRRAQHQTERDRATTRRRLRLIEARRRVALAETLVQAAERQLVDATERYREAAATPTELTRAQAQRTEAAAQLMTAKLDRARAALSLER